MKGWRKRVGRAYAHPDFGRIEGAARQSRCAAILLAQSDFQTLRHPCHASPLDSGIDVRQGINIGPGKFG
jgi:hypothetical protein